MNGDSTGPHDPGALPVELRRRVVGRRAREGGAPDRVAVLAARPLPGAVVHAVHTVRMADGSTLGVRPYVWTQFLANESGALEV